MIFGTEQWWHVALVFAAGLGGGAINAMAGGGTILTFPTLLAFGLSPVSANVTSAVALWPGGFGAVWGFRREIMVAERWWLWLVFPSLAGGAIGAVLLLNLPSHVFASIAPYLVLIASGFIALERPFERLLPLGRGGGVSRRRRIAAFLAQFVVSVYGGYFGASLGILVLAALSLVGVANIAQANGLKNLFGIAAKGVAVIYFVVAGEIVWDVALLTGAGAILGGYAAGELGHRIDERTMRWLILLVGFGVAIALFVTIK